MAKIKHIRASEILNSKGDPTVEVTVVLNDGAIGIAACPSGTSVGSFEAVELKDRDEKRYRGLGVSMAIDNIHSMISPRLIGMDALKQPDIDKTMIELDGTLNKSRLGANAILAVSMAVCKASARSSVLPLFLYLREFIKKEGQSIRVPTPLFNVINGGKHAGDRLDFQEFLVIPASSKSYADALHLGTTLYHSLKDILKQNNLPTLIGDEGGYSPLLTTNADAFLLLKQAVDASSHRFGFDIFFGLDAAATNFYDQKTYKIKDKPSGLTSEELIAYYKELNGKYHLLYLEDPLAEQDWEGWQKIIPVIGQETLVVGDDLTVTNPYRLQMALDKKAISGIIIKPNQIGTVIEALAVVEIAKQSGLKIIVSHRSGETNDDFIADFAVAVCCDYVKFGAPARGERVAKYNRLLQIEQQIRALG